MNNRMKNIVSWVITFGIITFLVFAIMYWVFGFDTKSALIYVAIPVAITSFFTPYIWNYFKRKRVNK